MSETGKSYNGIERANHWIAAIAIISLLGMGWILYLEALSGGTEKAARDLHKAFGTIMLAFAIWRVGYRLVRGFPAPVAALGSGQLLLSRVVHYLLLALIVIMPASGFFKSLFAGRPIDMFGLFTIGSPDTKNDAIAGIATSIHFAAGIAITVILLLHIAAALKHHFVERDGTLSRMLRG
jgi:cytochrome b561